MLFRSRDPRPQRPPLRGGVVSATLINVSGGRTSAYMLRRILDAHGGVLPDDVFVVFANTGKERAETLDFVRDCAERWGVPIHWVERRGRAWGGQRWTEVTYDTASRDGEPFAELIIERKFPPSVVMRFCTTELKIRVMRDFMLARGFKHWTNVVGLRADETSRVMGARAHADRERWDIECPLHSAGIRVEDVAAFWRAQPFDLRLQSYEGNCDLCFLKGRAKRERIMREHPEFADWWIAQEEFVKGRFHAHEPGYAKVRDKVLRLPLLPMDLDPDGEDDSIPCTCTD